MFPYLKKISDFISDCETVRKEICLNKAGDHEFVTLYKPRRSDKHFTCDRNCEKCKNIPSVVTWLIKNVSEANWGSDSGSGINTVAFLDLAIHQLINSQNQIIAKKTHNHLNFTLTIQKGIKQ